MAVRYLLADGDSAEITQAELADLTGLSQSTVNAAVNSWLDADGQPLEDAPIMVERVARSDVRGVRWRFTTRTLPEVVANGGVWHRSESDLPQPAPTPPIPTPQNARADRSDSDQHEDHESMRGVGGDAPTALLAPEQALLYNALLAEGVEDRTSALKAAQAMPGCTITEFRDQVAYATERGKNDPIAFVISFWRDGRQFRRPPQKEATTPAQKGQPNGSRRSAPAAPAPNRNVPAAVSPPRELKRARLGDWKPRGAGGG